MANEAARTIRKVTDMISSFRTFDVLVILHRLNGVSTQFLRSGQNKKAT